MNITRGKSLLFILVAAAFITASLYILITGTGSEGDLPVTGPPPAAGSDKDSNHVDSQDPSGEKGEVEITGTTEEHLPDDKPLYIADMGIAEDAEEIEVIVYPDNPAPGDFLIVEASPVVHPDDVNIDYDFEGELSTLYVVANRLYFILAVCYDTEPGSYNLVIDTTGDNGHEEVVAKAGLFDIDIDIIEKQFQEARFSMPAGTTAGWSAARLAEDREKIHLARENSSPRPLWLQKFVPPLKGPVTSEYAAIRIIDNNPPRRHAGIDYGLPEGTPIVATNSGMVRLAEHLLAGGKTVIIDHGLGLTSAYMHMHTMDVEEGRIVTRGEQIGTVGMTGYATGPHLHWEVRIGHTPVNPEQLLDNDLLWIPPAYVELFMTRKK